VFGFHGDQSGLGELRVKKSSDEAYERFMTRWHSDRPVEPVRAVRPIGETPSVGLFRTVSAQSISIKIARQYFNAKLREWAKRRARDKTKSSANTGETE
jgi:hypothetical protein